MGAAALLGSKEGVELRDKIHDDLRHHKLLRPLTHTEERLRVHSEREEGWRSAGQRRFKLLHERQ
jgi:hypothetical protein